MKKVVIVLLVVVVAVMVAVLVLRPGGSSTSTTPPGWLQLIGGLAPHRDVAAADVAGQECWSGEQLVVAAGTGCTTRLPDRANRIRLCVAQGPFAEVSLDGRTYGPQNVDKEEVACPTGKDFTLYDEATRLVAACPPLGGPCVLRLL